MAAASPTGRLPPEPTSPKTMGVAVTAAVAGISPPRRISISRAVSARLDSPDRRFLLMCLGNEAEKDGFLSVCSSEGFRSMSNSPRSPGTRSSSARRRSRVFFDMHSNSEQSSEAGDEPGDAAVEPMFRCNGMEPFLAHIGEDSDEDGDAGEELEALFRFDLELVAEALRRGAGVEELAQVIEESMSNALESRLESMLPEAFGEILEAKQPSAMLMPFTAAGKQDDEVHGGGATPSMCSNLSGRMTPQEGEGQGEEFGSPAATPDELVAHVHEALTSPSNRRASASAQRRLSTKLVDAFSEESKSRRENVTRACLEGRVSLGGGRKFSELELRQYVTRDARLHRMSFLKAAEVLETAGVDVEGSDFGVKARAAAGVETIVGDQLRRVKDAVEAARRRHRQSVVQAVHEAARGVGAEKLPCQSLAAEKVQQIIARAYARHQEFLGKQRQGVGRRSKSPSSKGVPEALLRSGCLVALMHARSGDSSMPWYGVHCGFAKDDAGPNMESPIKRHASTTIMKSPQRRRGLQR